jgi:hypothetical protein
MAIESFFSQSHNLSLAWAEMFLKLMQPGITTLAPAVITITQFDADQCPREHLDVRHALDRALEGHQKQSCQTVATTLFPESMWQPGAPGTATDFFSRYERIWAKIQRHPLNHRGVYFRRLTAYQPKSPDGKVQIINQLQHVIDTYNSGNHRHSALQAAIFDPTRDHTNCRRQGFPCLQQISFSVDGNTIGIAGIYAKQHHFEKAYGNYLGLCGLGRFMAHQMGLRLIQTTCIATELALGNTGKNHLRPLEQEIRTLLERHKEAA